jgi:hypothetical protein
MKFLTIKSLILAGIVAAGFAGSVMADHNSPFGAGADTVNRYSDGTRGQSRRMTNGGSFNRGGNG